jgi:PAS domain S-box-containing protein
MAFGGKSRIASRSAFAAVLRYGLAVVSVATALGATFFLRHYDFPPRFISHFTLIAIAITFWYAGTAPGLLAFLLSCLGLSILDRYHLLLSGFPLESFLIFTAIFSLLASWFSASRRRTQQLLTEAHNTLELRVSERTAELVRTNDDLQNAQAELRRSEALAEQRLRLVVDTTPALINSCRPDGYLDYVNKGWLDYFGFSLETALDRADVMKMSPPSKTEISGSDWQPVIHPEDLPGFTEQWKSMLVSGKPGEREARARRFDGVYRWLLFRAVPLYDDTGKLGKWYASAFDIEDRKRAEEALRRSESSLAEAQRLAHTASWAWRVAGRDALHLSEEWYRIYGFDPQKGMPAWEERLQRIHPEDRAKWQGTIDRAIDAKSDYEMEFRILLPDGAVKYVHTVGHPVLNASGDLIEFVGSATDITERKQAEDALRRSEASLHEAQRLGQLGSWMWDRSSGTVFASPELLRIIGVNPEEKSRTRGMMIEVGDREAFAGHVHPEDRHFLDEVAHKAVAEKRDWEFEYRIVLPNGSIRYVHTRGRPVFDDSGELVEYIGTMMDITERKQAEEALRRSEGYLAEAERLTRTGSWAWNVATRQSVYWSQENYRLFGFEPEGGIPSDEAFYQRIHPKDRDRVRRDVFLERPDEGSHFDVDFRIVLPDGAIKYLRSTGHPVRNMSGDPIEYVGTSIDVTERKRVEDERERLLASERAAFAEVVAAQQRFRDLVNSVEGIVWEADVPSFQFRFISKQAERVLGYPVERWLSEPAFWKEHVHPEDREWALQFCQTATAEKRNQEFEYRMIAADGSVVWLRDMVTVVVEGDRVTRVRGVMVDLTNRKLAEEALRQAQADLAHVSRVTTMGELTVSLAHEVNQPIAAAVTNANTCMRWLASDTPNIEEARAAAMRIVKDGTRAGEIISRIRMLFTKGTAQHEWVDVNEVIGEMIVLLRAETARHSISVRTELAADLPQVMGDRVQLQQVLMNLMINGVDAMQDANGTRELAIKSQRTENEEVAVSVTDTGVGLPTQQAEQIFNAFFTTKPNGTGMGLRISRSIIESHRGRLWAADNFPRGATFHFTLPTKADAHE